MTSRGYIRTVQFIPPQAAFPAPMMRGLKCLSQITAHTQQSARVGYDKGYQEGYADAVKNAQDLFLASSRLTVRKMESLEQQIHVIIQEAVRKVCKAELQLSTEHLQTLIRPILDRLKDISVGTIITPRCKHRLLATLVKDLGLTMQVVIDDAIPDSAVRIILPHGDLMIDEEAHIADLLSRLPRKDYLC